MSLTVKVYFKDEIRRVAVDATVATNYDYLENRIRSAFGNYRGELSLKWRDADGDLITFTSDAELTEALTASANEGVFKVYAVVKEGEQQKQQPGNEEKSEQRSGAAGAWHVPGASMFHGFGPMPNLPQFPGCSVGFGAGFPQPGFHPAEFLKNFEKMMTSGEEMLRSNIDAQFFTQEQLAKIENCSKTAGKNARGVVPDGKEEAAEKAVTAGVARGIKSALMYQKATKMSHDDSMCDVDMDEFCKDFQKCSTDSSEKPNVGLEEFLQQVYNDVEASFGSMAADWASGAARNKMRLFVKKTQQTEEPKKTEEEPVVGGGSTAQYTDLARDLQEMAQKAAEDEDEKRIADAVRVFGEMGYPPEQWLVQRIRDCHGDISAVFESLRPGQQK